MLRDSINLKTGNPRDFLILRVVDKAIFVRIKSRP
jgi:hypothetical protein